jgi:hypothetical protein
MPAFAGRVRKMSFKMTSIRTRMLVLLAGIALVVGGVSVSWDLVAGQGLLRQQIVKRGRYIASNLAFNAKYGVLTEDRPLLRQFLEGATSAGAAPGGSDVVGAMIRDAKGEVLAEVGKGIRKLPAGPPEDLEEIEATTPTASRCCCSGPPSPPGAGGRRPRTSGAGSPPARRR